jgi:hypothetical protein
MHKHHTKLQTAQQRWLASGFAKQSPFKDRLAMLDDLMTRADLTGTQKSILWYLAYRRTNTEIGLCCATDQQIADAVGVKLSIIKKSKQKLKALGILTWLTERLNGKNQICLYQWCTNVHPKGTSKIQEEGCTNVHHQHNVFVHHEPKTMVYKCTPSKTARIFIRADTPDWQTIETHWRASGRGSPPRAGLGWYFAPSELPDQLRSHPGHRPDERKNF